MLEGEAWGSSFKNNTTIGTKKREKNEKEKYTPNEYDKDILLTNL